ncbi:MAG: amidohydrolase [Firmicutes bacterium]|nr:amidohydrolase [Bacillota bacterium]
MIIDVHAHPLLFDLITPGSGDSVFEWRRQNFGLYKSGITSAEFFLKVADHAKVDRTVLLPEDYSAEMGRPLISNDEIAKIVTFAPERFIGFASVDPRSGGAAEELERAFTDLKLSGLKLNLSHLHMFPSDARLRPLLELCLRYGKPVTFHCGYSWEPDSPSKYSTPIDFEDIAVEYPELRFCLAHLGFPWVAETVMMILKYPNVYTDTSTVFMGSPRDWYRQIFTVDMGIDWLENNFADKVMYGSNNPRWRQERALDGLLSLGLREDVVRKITGENALRFLGMETADVASADRR